MDVSNHIHSGNQSWLAGKSSINGGFHRKITDEWSIFQPAMFDYRRVSDGEGMVPMVKNAGWSDDNGDLSSGNDHQWGYNGIHHGIYSQCS